MKRATGNRSNSAAGIPRSFMIGVASLVMLAACDSKKVDEALEQAQEANAYTHQTCMPRVSASSASRRIPDPEKPSACFAVVMICNYCEYDPNGLLTSSGMTPCGVCVGWDTP